MSNNNKIRVDIDGDASGLQKALKQSSQSLSTFGGEAEGFAGDFASTISGGLGKASTVMTGFVGALSVAALGIAATFAKVQESSEKAFEVFQAASLSQMGIAQIQQIANMYASVGLTMENVADQQKDLKDKLQDALFNKGGSMYTDVIQPLKLNVLELQKMAAQGDDVYAKIYFSAKQMGYNSQELVNMFETIGNDATKRLTVLKQFNTEQDYNNSLSNQTIQLTAEQSSQFEEYRTATRNLANAWDQWNNSTLAPIAKNLADILELITKILNSKPVSNAAVATSKEGVKAVQEYQAGFQQDLLANSSIYGAQLVEQQRKEQAANDKAFSTLVSNLDAANAVINQKKQQYAEGSTKNTINSVMKQFQTTKEQTQAKIDALDAQYAQTKDEIQKSLYKAYDGDQKALQKDLDKLAASYKGSRDALIKTRDADDDKAAAEAKRKADALSKQQAALEKKNAADRITATRDLNKAIADMTIDSNARQLAEFDRQQHELVLSIQKSAKTLGLSQDKVQALLTQQQLSSAAKRNDLINGMIGYQDPNKSLKDTNNLLQNGNLNSTQTSFLADQQNKRINGDNPFAYDNTDQKLKDNQEAMNAELAQNDLLLKGHEDYEKRKAEITAKYNTQAITISNQNAQDQLSIFSKTANSLSDSMVAAFGESSGAAQAAFAVSRGITIAQTVLSIQSALAQALATPFPASLAAYAQVASLGLSIISTAKGASHGQFHGGVDELPSSYDNKSFVLKAGERVVQPEANKKLTKFLDGQTKGSSTAGDITVNAPLIVQGDVSGSDAKFNEMLKKHSNSVAQAVRDSQKRNT